PCEKSSDFRAVQCAAFNNVPYSGQLLKWYPHYDPARPCALICRGEQTLENSVRRSRQEVPLGEKTMPRDSTDSLLFDSDETIVVELADKVEDGTKCYAEGTDVCISGECMFTSEFEQYYGRLTSTAAPALKPCSARRETSVDVIRQQIANGSTESIIS
ncbi:ADAMTS-like protein 3, partial [Trachymyrmex cornetzi]